MKTPSEPRIRPSKWTPGERAFKGAKESAAILRLLEQEDGRVQIRLIRDYWDAEDGIRLVKGEVFFFRKEEADLIVKAGAGVAV